MGVAHRFGNAADHLERVRRYPSDMTDAESEAVRPLLPVPAWLRGRGGKPEAYCHHAMLDAIRCLMDNGIKWRAMPKDSLPWDRVHVFEYWFVVLPKRWIVERFVAHPMLSPQPSCRTVQITCRALRAIAGFVFR